MMQRISLEQTVCRADNKLLVSALGDELVMMDVENGSYHNMNSVGTAIWEMIRTPILVKQLLQQLLKIYAISEQQCLEELLEFLSMLNEHHLIRLT